MSIPKNVAVQIILAKFHSLDIFSKEAKKVLDLIKENFSEILVREYSSFFNERGTEYSRDMGHLAKIFGLMPLGGQITLIEDAIADDLSRPKRFSKALLALPELFNLLNFKNDEHEELLKTIRVGWSQRLCAKPLSHSDRVEMLAPMFASFKQLMLMHCVRKFLAEKMLQE